MNGRVNRSSVTVTGCFQTCNEQEKCLKSESRGGGFRTATLAREVALLFLVLELGLSRESIYLVWGLSR